MKIRRFKNKETSEVWYLTQYNEKFSSYIVKNLDTGKDEVYNGGSLKALFEEIEPEERSDIKTEYKLYTGRKTKKKR